ncbi:medium-chain fatty acid-CoA ligase faa2, partial [Coemansia sp. S85]
PLHHHHHAPHHHASIAHHHHHHHHHSGHHAPHHHHASIAHHHASITHHSSHHHHGSNSYVVPNSARPGYSAILRHPEFPSGKVPDDYPMVTTLYDLFQRALIVFPTAPFLGARQYSTLRHELGEYRWRTTREIAELIDWFGSGLDQLYDKHVGRAPGFSPLHQTPLGIYSKNRIEWVVAEFAGFRARRFSVALYDTLSSDCVEHIVNHAQIPVVVCSVDKVATLLALKCTMPSLRVIISMDSLQGKARGSVHSTMSSTAIRALYKHAEGLGVVLLDMAAVVEMGRANISVPKPPNASDICTICYTSGTTGPQKGVVSTHGNYVSAAKSLYHSMPLYHSTYLSFFTLASCFERSILYTGMLGGMRVGFFSGDVTQVAEDAQALKPTVMAGVPHLFNFIYHRITAATIYAPGLSGAMARTAIKQKLQKLESGKGGVKHNFWDKLVCNKIAQYFGGRLKLLISGGDPIDARVLGFLRVAVSCPVLESYGLGECCSAATACLLSDKTSGHVGVPLPGVDICLRDIPEMDYITTTGLHPRGELLVRGPSVFLGYYRDEAKTHVALDGDWLATGDIATINDDGNIEIIDRKENVVRIREPFDQSVALEYLETVYSRHPLVHDIFIYSDPDHADLVAVVVPDPEAFLPLARKITDLKSATIEELVNNAQVINAMLVVLFQHGKKARLRTCEMIADIYCDPVPFDIEGNGLLTPTYKLKRRVAIQHYRSQIDHMYVSIKAKAQ